MKEIDGDDLGAWSEFGTAAGIAATRAAGDAPPPATEGLGDAPAGAGGGDSDPAQTGFGDAPQTGFGDAPDLDGLPPVGGLGQGLAGAVRQGADQARIAGYHNRVDADGDCHLDHATYRSDPDGGVEILVDLNGDGHTDFIGHDTNMDNRVDYADYDKDHDGVFEKRMYDDNGDGYLDRTEWLHGS
jgi:hypothetical protein